MSFQGWPDEALEFYEGLEADNSRAYWQAHKAIYEASVLRPMQELLSDLEPYYGETKIFRPYRDVRFSHDKSLYKTAIMAIIGPGYVRFSADGLAAGSGRHEMAGEQLTKYREAVGADAAGSALEELIADLRKQDIEVQGTAPLKTAPRGYAADHPRIELLRFKGLYAWKEWPVEPWLGTAAVRQVIAGFLTATGPLSDWLAKHVGP
ncbi:MAG TPA: DUF2461 domain-containing protein [Streptosporangiaceae bacterium]|jgi:uncharacterized protein (TIGR02453 family)